MPPFYADDVPDAGAIEEAGGPDWKPDEAEHSPGPNRKLAKRPIVLPGTETNTGSATKRVRRVGEGKRGGKTQTKSAVAQPQQMTPHPVGLLGAAGGQDDGPHLVGQLDALLANTGKADKVRGGAVGVSFHLPSPCADLV